jgi:hypothetical protein
VIWFIPIKTYRLPVPLPVNLEVYRLVIGAFLFALVTAVLVGRAHFSAGGQRGSLTLLIVVATVSLIVNLPQISAGGLQSEALKSFSFFLGYLLIFVLVASTLRRIRDIELAITAFVAGGVVISIASLIEQHTKYNVFDHLHNWLPFLVFQGHGESIRLGLLRARASAQHPIALGVALTLCIPLALYLWRHAASRLRGLGWLLAAFITATGAFSTISRTVVVVMVGMTLVALTLRSRELVRYSPLLIAIPLAVPVVAPGALRSLYKSLTPQGGLVQQQSGRSGLTGSGRISDLKPGFHLWAQSPLVGGGLGTSPTRGDDPITAAHLSTSAAAKAQIIFDDQYLGTLVAQGAAGLVAIVWFVWGAFIKLGRAAKRARGPTSDLLVACSTCCAGFAASMFTHDAFAFVQSTVLFFIVAALGMRVRALQSA